MSLQESITARLGLDTSEFKRGLRTAKVNAEQLRDQLKDIGIGLGVGTGLAGIKEVIEHFKELGKTADDFGVSTDYLQTFFAAFKKGGGDVEDAEKGLKKLVILIGEAREGSETAQKSFSDYGISLNNLNSKGKSTKEIIGNIADVIASQSDATRQASIAASFFGSKLGVDFVDPLKEGSKALQDLEDKKTKGAFFVTETDIANMTELNEGLKVYSKGITGIVGKLTGIAVRASARIGTYLGNLSVTGNGIKAEEAIADSEQEQLDLIAKQKKAKEDLDSVDGGRKKQAQEALKIGEQIGKLNEEIARQEQTTENLIKEKNKAQKEFDATTEDSADRYTKFIKLKQKELELGKAMKDLDKERNNLAERQFEAAQKLSKLQESLAQKKGDRLKFGSLEELVNRDPASLDREARRQRMAAIQIQRMQADVEFFKGRDPARAGRIQSDIDSRLKGLTRVSESVTMPFKDMEIQIKEQSTELKNISAILSGVIRVQAHNGQ